MSTGTRKLRAVRPVPQPTLFESGGSGLRPATPLELPGDDRPLGILRLGSSDLEFGLAAAGDGARPSAVINGITETREARIRTKRMAADTGIPWMVDPLVFRTSLPGYRTSTNLKLLNYTPGVDAEPYDVSDFDDPSLLRTVGRDVVGSQVDMGAAAAFTGCFVASAPDDAWTRITRDLARVGVDARDAMEPIPVIASLALRMKGFDDLEAQRVLARAMSARRPDAFYLMLDGVHAESGPERLANVLRMATLLRAVGGRVIISRAGDLRRLFLAFGFDVEYGLGRYLRFSVPDYMKSSGGLGAFPKRFELRSLVASVHEPIASAAIQAELVAESTCACPACRRSESVAKRMSRAQLHNAHSVAREIDEAGTEPINARVEHLANDLSMAGHIWSDLVRQGIVESTPKYLESWREAAETAVGWGVLEPDFAERQLDLG